MAAGIPGTGIGGVFYFLLVVLMPIRELWLTISGRSNWKRWKTILWQWTLCGSILGALWGEAWLLKRGFEWLSSSGVAGGLSERLATMGSAALIPAVAMSPFIILGTLFLAVHVARLVMYLRPRVASTLPTGVAAD